MVLDDKGVTGGGSARRQGVPSEEVRLVHWARSEIAAQHGYRDSYQPYRKNEPDGRYDGLAGA
jgi:hypothetical protein